ncbi:Fic/DOC family protein [Thalassolituus sp. UBA2590]|uniref:Fic/DOC family protein n=1 Tax=Thalassolituus sp. UBA2590 TaxID=1947663 RepID=UPI002647A61F|nr:Fic family protein [Thalassolituus sp. UBA2590]
MGRYDVIGSEGEYEPSSDGKVLANKAHISGINEINVAETELLQDLYAYVFGHFPQELNWNVICQWHRMWLGNLYPWAGSHRSVDMSKPEIHFASPLQISKLATRYDETYLSQFEDLPETDDEDLILFLAEMHVEFILIHPFREGNGRISRLLMDVMAVKAGLQPLDYTLWDENKEFYFKAIQAGRDGDYRHIARLVGDVLENQALG